MPAMVAGPGVTALAGFAGTYHAFRTTATGKINAAADLGTLGGTNSYAFDVNNSGQAVGSARVGPGWNTECSFCWTGFP